jgi:outer membrane protein assembly factor BamE (lipoprotein component of BamABCDE complex)
MRPLLLCVLALALTGCSIIYKLPTRQGNVMDQTKLDQLQVGQTRDQVRFLLGTPVASSLFKPDRWDYFGYYKDPRGRVTSRNVSLYFSGDKLARMEGVKLASNSDKPLDTPDVDTIQKQQKKEANEASRAASEQGKDSGIVVSQPTPQP